MGKLDGRLAIITGGGQGVGLGIAQAFADQGASLVLTGRHLEKLQGVVSDFEKRGSRVQIHISDVRSRVDAERAVSFTKQVFGTIDILVNNAQSASPGTMLADTSDELIASTVESGLYGSIYFMQAVLPHMIKQGGGSIINMGSRQGIISPPGFGIYGATKEAIRSISRTAAREWGSTQNSVNVINPSAMSPAAIKWVQHSPEEAQRNLLEVSLRRWGDAAADIGPVAVFLASDDSRYVSGQTINVDGGMVMM